MADVSFVSPQQQDDPRIAALMGGQVPDPVAAARAYAATVAMNDVSPTTSGAAQVQPPGYAHQTGEDAMTVPGLVRTAQDPSNSMPMRLTAAVPMALGQMAGERVSAAADAVKGPGDAVMGNLDPFSQEGTDRANTLATMLMGGGFAGAEPGAVGIFGSRLAPGLRQQVMNMERTGMDPGKIWHDTGVFRAPDSLLKNEIPDDQARLREIARNNLADGMVLTAGNPDTFAHKALYSQYPELANTRITGTVPGNARGISYGGEIGLANQSGPEMTSTGVHEMQHEVQNLIGAARGGSPDEFVLPGSQLNGTANNMYSLMRAKNLLEADPRSLLARKLFGDVVGYTPDHLGPEDIHGTIGDYLKNYQSQLENAGEDGRVGYRKLAGEVEARNAQKRQQFTPQQRREKPPWETWDVPADQQIIRFNPQ